MSFANPLPVLPPPLISWPSGVHWACVPSVIPLRHSVLMPAREGFLISPQTCYVWASLMVLSYSPEITCIHSLRTSPSLNSGITKLSSALPLKAQDLPSHTYRSMLPQWRTMSWSLDCCALPGKTGQLPPQPPRPGPPEDATSHPHWAGHLLARCPAAPAHPASTSPTRALGRNQRRGTPATGG